MRAQRVLWLATSLSALSACAPTIPHRIEDRTVDLAAVVTLQGLPSHARVVEERDGTRRVIAIATGGTATVTIPYRATEHVDNGDVSAHRDLPLDRVVVVEARGYLPRTLTLHAPRDTVVDAHLERPALYWIQPHDAPLDAALAASLEGDCGTASTLATQLTPNGKTALDSSLVRCGERAARRQGTADTRDWDPSSLGIPGDDVAKPDKAIADMQVLANRESDPDTGRAVDGIRRLALHGDLDEAARVAELLADSLPSKRAALTLELPAAVFADARARSARALLLRKDARAAMDLERRAYAIAPFVAAPTYATVRRVRALELLKSGVALETKNPLAARGYFAAARTTDPTLAEADAAQRRTDAAATNAARAHLVVRSTDDASARTLTSALAAVVPKHVTVDTDPANATATLFLAVSSTERSIKATETHGKKSVLAFRITKHNDAYDQAQQDLADAQENMQTAEDSAAQLRQQAQQLRDQASSAGGAAAAFGAGGAAGEEATAAGLIIAAKTRLSNARAKLASTPQTVREDVKKDASYPILHFEADAVRRIKARLEGLGDAIEVGDSAVAHLSSDQVIGDPKIGVASTPSPQSAIAALEPDVTPLYAKVAAELGKEIAAREEARAWAMVEEARSSGRADVEAAASALYMAIAPGSPREGEILRRLAEVLP